MIIYTNITILLTSFVPEYRFYHIYHAQLVVLPHSVYDRVVLIEDSIPVEFVLLEVALVSLTVVKILYSLAIEHSVLPYPFVLLLTAFSEQSAEAALHTILKLALVPASIGPPEGASSVSFARLKLTLIHVRLLTSPPVQAPAVLLIKPEITHIVIACGKVQLALSLELAVSELTVYDFVSILEETHAAAVRTVDLCLSEVNYLCVLVEFWVVEGGVH